MNLAVRKNTAFQRGSVSYLNSSDASSSNSFFSNNSVRVPTFRSNWVIELEQRFDELAELQYDWDGYDGKPVSWTCATFAARLLESLYSARVPAPSIVPGSDGTLQIEWHMNRYDIEIDIIAPYEVTVNRFDHISREDEEFELQSDFSILARWVSDLGKQRDFENALTA